MTESSHASRSCPRKIQDWLRLGVFPFKSYVIVVSVLFLLSIPFRTQHSGPSDAEVWLLLGLLPCSLVLLVAALVFALVGPKGLALPCAAYGAAAFYVAGTFLPALSS